MPPLFDVATLLPSDLRCDVDPDKVSAVEPDDDEGIEQVEPIVGTTNKSMAAMSGAWLCKKVRHPWLGGPHRLTMYLATLDCRDLKSELEQFAVDAWRAPKRIFDAHPPDQHAHLRFDLRSPSPWARLQPPVATKTGLCNRTASRPG